MSGAGVEKPRVRIPDALMLDVRMLGYAQVPEVQRRHYQKLRGWYASADAAANLLMMGICSMSTRISR